MLRSKSGLPLQFEESVYGGRTITTVTVRLEHTHDEARATTRIENERSDFYPIISDADGVSDSTGPTVSGRVRLDVVLAVPGARVSDALRGQYDYGRSQPETISVGNTTWRTHGYVYEGPHRTFTYDANFQIEIRRAFIPKATSGGTPAGRLLAVCAWLPLKSQEHPMSAEKHHEL